MKEPHRTPDALDGALLRALASERLTRGVLALRLGVTRAEVVASLGRLAAAYITFSNCTVRRPLSTSSAYV